MLSRAVASGMILLMAVSLCAQQVKPRVGGGIAAPAGPPSGDKLPPGSYTGKLLSLPAADGAFTMEITSQVTEVKSNANALVQSMNKFQQDFQNGLVSIQRDLATGRDSAHHQRRLLDHLSWYQRHAPAYAPGGSHYPYAVKSVTQTIDFHASPDFKVRTQDPPLEFTDKGAPKKYTQAELTKLRGKDRLPGYESKKEELNTGALVKVTLARPKPVKKGDVTAKEALFGRPNQVTVFLIISKDGNPPMPTLRTNVKK